MDTSGLVDDSFYGIGIDKLLKLVDLLPLKVKILRTIVVAIVAPT